jgi:integrase
MVFILCRATGLRIGETLGLEIDKHISSDFMTITINQKVRQCKVEDRVKTASAVRQVDLHPSIAEILKDFARGRKAGFLICTRNGKPVGSSNIIRRHLHPALKQLGFINSHTGTHEAGNHAFGRFRNSYLRSYTECTEGVRNFWMGHSDETMGDLDDKIKEDAAFRKMWAEKCGFGFELPSVVPMVPKKDGKAATEKAA